MWRYTWAMGKGRWRWERKWASDLPGMSAFSVRSCRQDAWQRPSILAPTEGWARRTGRSASGVLNMGTGLRVFPGKSTAIGRKAGTLTHRRYGRMFSICWMRKHLDWPRPVSGPRRLRSTRNHRQECRCHKGKNAGEGACGPHTFSPAGAPAPQKQGRKSLFFCSQSYRKPYNLGRIPRRNP